MVQLLLQEDFFGTEAGEPRPVFLQEETGSTEVFPGCMGTTDRRAGRMLWYPPADWGAGEADAFCTLAQSKCDLRQIKQHSAMLWETPKQHQQYYSLCLSRLACPAPLREGWITVVTVPHTLKLAQGPLQSPALHWPPRGLCGKWEQNH